MFPKQGLKFTTLFILLIFHLESVTATIESQLKRSLNPNNSKMIQDKPKIPDIQNEQIKIKTPLKKTKKRRTRKRRQKKMKRVNRDLYMEQQENPDYNDLFTGKMGLDHDYRTLIDDQQAIEKKMNDKQAALYHHYRQFEDSKKNMKRKRNKKLRKLLQASTVDNFFMETDEAPKKKGEKTLEISENGLIVRDEEGEKQKSKLMGMRNLKDLTHLDIHAQLSKRHLKLKRDSKEDYQMREDEPTFNSPRNLKEVRKTVKHVRNVASPSFLVRNHDHHRKIFKAEKGMTTLSERRLKKKNPNIAKLKKKFLKDFKYNWKTYRWTHIPRYTFNLINSIKELKFWKTMGFKLKKSKLVLESRYDVNRKNLGSQMQCNLTAYFRPLKKFNDIGRVYLKATFYSNCKPDPVDKIFLGYAFRSLLFRISAGQLSFTLTYLGQASKKLVAKIPKKKRKYGRRGRYGRSRRSRYGRSSRSRRSRRSRYGRSSRSRRSRYGRRGRYLSKNKGDVKSKKGKGDLEKRETGSKSQVAKKAENLVLSKKVDADSSTQQNKNGDSLKNSRKLWWRRKKKRRRRRSRSRRSRSRRGRYGRSRRRRRKKRKKRKPMYNFTYSSLRMFPKLRERPFNAFPTKLAYYRAGLIPKSGLKWNYHKLNSFKKYQHSFPLKTYNQGQIMKKMLIRRKKQARIDKMKREQARRDREYRRMKHKYRTKSKTTYSKSKRGRGRSRGRRSRGRSRYGRRGRYLKKKDATDPKQIKESHSERKLGQIVKSMTPSKAKSTSLKNKPLFKKTKLIQTEEERVLRQKRSKTRELIKESDFAKEPLNKKGVTISKKNSKISKSSDKSRKLWWWKKKKKKKKRRRTRSRRRTRRRRPRRRRPPRKTITRYVWLPRIINWKMEGLIGGYQQTNPNLRVPIITSPSDPSVPYHSVDMIWKSANKITMCKRGKYHTCNI